jgi:predicted phosphodiesterase
VFGRVALLSDVHGNLPALEACLVEVRKAGVDAIFFLGDLTWGPQPREVLELAASLSLPTWFVAGNAERAIVELARGDRQSVGATGDWLVQKHGEDGVAKIAEFAPSLSVLADSIGPIRLCHGSPRSDLELLTPSTPPKRIREATRGLSSRAFAHGHTHLQYQREVDNRLVIAPGSVGIPYGANAPGARWALIGETISLRSAPYDVELAVDAATRCDYPGLDRYATDLRNPPTVDEIVADAELREFAD